MIPKSGNRFSDKIMLDQKRLESDSTQLNRILGVGSGTGKGQNGGRRKGCL
jgi:hypothetical protein